jgi:hypothetical protein
MADHSGDFLKNINSPSFGIISPLQNRVDEKRDGPISNF